jgi:hypothetical protein
MAVTINEELAALLSEEDTVKLLVTTDEKGAPHAVVKKSLQLNEEKNQLIYFELLESSHTNKNMVRSIWFDHPVAVAVVGADDSSYEIKGKPVKAIVSGPAFRKYYEQLRAKHGDVDLATVWVIEPQEIVNQSFPVRRQQEEETRPYFKHLDRLAK